MPPASAAVHSPSPRIPGKPGESEEAPLRQPLPRSWRPPQRQGPACPFSDGSGAQGRTPVCLLSLRFTRDSWESVPFASIALRGPGFSSEAGAAFRGALGHARRLLAIPSGGGGRRRPRASLNTLQDTGHLLTTERRRAPNAHSAAAESALTCSGVCRWEACCGWMVTRGHTLSPSQGHRTQAPPTRGFRRQERVIVPFWRSEVLQPGCRGPGPSGGLGEDRWLLCPPSRGRLCGPVPGPSSGVKGSSAASSRLSRTLTLLLPPLGTLVTAAGPPG